MGVYLDAYEGKADPDTRNTGCATPYKGRERLQKLMEAAKGKTTSRQRAFGPDVDFALPTDIFLAFTANPTPELPGNTSNALKVV